MNVSYKKSNARFLVALTPLVVLAAFALFWNLGDRLLWGDEAETAVLAVNITKFGIPLATDGRNYITLIGAGRDTNASDVWVWSPWLDEYIAAASFAVLGESTTAARLPFALIGFLAVLFMPFLAQQIYRRNELTFTATLLFVTNVSMLLHARQCRYYSVVMLAQMTLLFGVHRILLRRNGTGITVVVLSLTAQFYCNYVLALSNLLAVLASVPLLRRRRPYVMRPALVSVGVFVVLALPWLVYARSGAQTSLIGFEDFGKKAAFYIQQTHFYIVPLVLFLLPLSVRLKKRRQTQGDSGAIEKDMQAFIVVYLAAHAVVLAITPGYYFRYLVPLMPVLVLLLSGMLCAHVTNKGLRYGIVALLAFTNVIPMATAYPFREKETFGIPIVRLLRDITTPYENSLGDVIAYLRKEGRPEHAVLVPDPGFPIIFYTGMRVIDSRLNQRLNLNELPEWILEKSPASIGPVQGMRMPPALRERYETITLTVHDSPNGDCRPDPKYHVPFTVERKTDFTIHRRRT